MNKKKLVIGIVALIVGIILSINAFAQFPTPNSTIVDTTLTNPKFLVAILGGVLMAFGFQFVLTNLSIALGITAIGNVRKKIEGLYDDKKKKYNKNKNNNFNIIRTDYYNILLEDDYDTEHEEENDKSTLNIGQKFMSATGVWALVTGAISLFFASMLAVKLSLVENNTIGFTLGLVIWAVFSMIMIYLESKAVGSLISGLWGTALSAIKAGFSGISSVFSKTHTQKAEDVASAVKKEVYQFMDETDLGKKFDKMVEKVKPTFDSSQFRKELADLLNDIKIEQKEGVTPKEKETYLRIAEKQPYFSKTDISNLDQIFDSVLAKIGLSGVSKQFGGLGTKASSYVKEEFLPKIKDDVEHYVMDRTTPNTNPEIVRAEIDEIFSHGIDARSILENKGRVFDKNNVATAVASQKGVSKEEAMDVADQLENALNEVLRESNIKEIVVSKFEEVKDKISDTIASKKEEYLGNFENRFEKLFKSIDRPELDYNLLKKEFELMLHNPSLAPKILRMKLNQLDANTITSLLTASGRFNTTEAENIISKFEEVKSNVFKKLDIAQNMMNEKTKKAAKFALEQTENARRAAITASWWLFATLVISGIAAGLGGIVGM